MPVQHHTVGIVVERRESSSPWADYLWAPVAVLPDAPDMAPWSLLRREPGREQYYLGPAELALFSVDTGQLRDNLSKDRPQLWVAVRPTGIDPPLELVGVTADPFEAEAYLENVGDVVEAVPMPSDLAAIIAAFFAKHHVEREFVKRKRDAHDPRKGGFRGRPPPGQER